MTTEPIIVCRCNAVRAVLPTASFLDRGTHIEWLSDNKAGTITEEQIAVELAKLQTAWDNFEYGRNRQMEYPPMEQQLDYIYHNGIDKWKTDIVDPVKTKYPKP